jgi:NAD(P)-dependent dehydrogenase (short-subunit alcohol dehydrogenase family)
MSVPSGAVEAAGRVAPLAGRTILVTGLSETLTDTLAVRIAHAARAKGAHVALAGPGHGQAPADGIHRFSGDFGSESNADRLLDHVGATFKELDIIIAVLAAEPIGAVHEISHDLWRKRVSEPLRAIFWLTRRAVEDFFGAHVAGRIVLVVQAAPGGGSTAVVEGAMRSFARSFAREYGRRRLACNLVLARVDDRGLAPSTHGVPAATIEHTLFLASPAASFMNGETLTAGAVRAQPVEE